jgi:hypothetical protein
VILVTAYPDSRPGVRPAVPSVLPAVDVQFALPEGIHPSVGRDARGCELFQVVGVVSFCT